MAFGGGFLPSLPVSSAGGANSLEERKRQLLQWLAQNGGAQAGYQGRAGTAVGRMGGIGGRAPLPSINFNPFLAQIAGRPNEVFPGSVLPQGLSTAAAAQAQQAPGPGMGLPPQAQGSPPTGVMPAGAPVQPPGGAAGRSLIGAAPTPPPIQSALSGAVTGPQAANPYVPYVDPLQRLASIGTRGLYRE